MKKILGILLLALMMTANAHNIGEQNNITYDGHVGTIYGNLVRDTFDDCVHTVYYNPAIDALDECQEQGIITK